MTDLIGHQRQIAAFLRAFASGKPHHAWILAGPQGLGKAHFARDAARHILSAGEGEAFSSGEGSESFRDNPDGQAAHLLAAGSHPDFRLLQRQPRGDKEARKAEQHGLDSLDEGELKRNISVEQVRSLLPMLNGSPAIAEHRVIVIDAVDDLERGGANALLKSLEEPPRNTFFLLVSHAPDRLLPTIRSRCQILRFEPLPDERIGDLLQEARPGMDTKEVAMLVAAANGSPGRALQYADAGLAEIGEQLRAIAAGDADNRHGIKLAQSLSGKAADARYRAFLAFAPGYAARLIRRMPTADQGGAVDLWQDIVALAQSAAPKSLEPQMVVFRICGLMARLGAHR